MKRFLAGRPLLATVTTMTVLAAGGLAVAAWLTSGSGSVTAKAGSSQTLSTIDASASTSATLFPGVTGDVVVRVSNPNQFAVRVTTISLNGTDADIAPGAGHAGCSPTGVSFVNQTGLTLDVPAGGATTATVRGAVSMSNASANACQGATFTIPVTLSGASNAS